MVVVDFNEELLDAVKPIILWRYKNFLRRVFEKQNPTKAQEGFDEKLNYFGKPVDVSYSFKMILILTDEKQFLGHSLLNKVLFFLILKKYKCKKRPDKTDYFFKNYRFSF